MQAFRGIRVPSAASDFLTVTVLRDGMGEQYAKVFAAVRRAEFEKMKGMTFDQERMALLERH